MERSRFLEGSVVGWMVRPRILEGDHNAQIISASDLLLTEGVYYSLHLFCWLMSSNYRPTTAGQGKGGLKGRAGHSKLQATEAKMWGSTSRYKKIVTMVSTHCSSFIAKEDHAIREIMTWLALDFVCE